MLLRIKTEEGDMLMEVDALNLDTLKDIMANIRKEWMSKILIVDGDNHFIIPEKDGNSGHDFNSSDSYEDVLNMCAGDGYFYRKMPINLIKKKFQEKGLVCNVKKLEDYCGFV